MNLAICCPSTGNHEAAIDSWLSRARENLTVTVYNNIEGEAAGYLQKVQRFYQRKAPADTIIAYFHSDLFINTHSWDELVLREFEDPDVALVSFFGAKQLGRSNIYREPYHYSQLARGDCWSNLIDAEVHGQRSNGAFDVAMIDSFSLIVRRSFLDQIGGWPMHCPPSHGSDMWLCMMCARHKKRIRFVGVSCSHGSGGVRGDGSFNYPEWAAKTKWISDGAMHQWWHRYLYEEFRDVLPIRVP